MRFEMVAPVGAQASDGKVYLFVLWFLSFFVVDHYE